MRIFIEYEGVHPIEVETEWCVADLKKHFQLVPAEEQLLFCRGRPLEDEDLIRDVAEQDDTIDLNVRLLGGKVHGSLAGAGKVKGQTPKVEKQEKRKKKTGRAKRRMQYNRRFVNTVASFGGRRRGPNTNMK